MSRVDSAVCEKRREISAQVLRHPAERVASWYAMRLRQFRGRVPCVDAPASNGSALARVLDVLTDARSQTVCASETSLRCCLRESNVPRKCMQGGVCGAARNLMTMIFAGWGRWPARLIFVFDSASIFGY